MLDGRNNNVKCRKVVHRAGSRFRGWDLAACGEMVVLSKPGQFAALVCLTLFASTLKVRIPGMTSTISPNFAFLLIAIAFFSFSQVIVATAGAALMQSFWRPKSRPQMVQVLFSAAALVLSSAFAFTAAHLLVRPFDNNIAVALVLLAVTFYLSM